jgi:hypothetical protein
MSSLVRWLAMPTIVEWPLLPLKLSTTQIFEGIYHLIYVECLSLQRFIHLFTIERYNLIIDD